MGPAKRQRRQRTVFNKEQLRELEEHFLNNQYPSYRAREDLAARINLEEYKVQGLGESREPLWQTPFLALELLSDQGRPPPPSSGLLCGLLKTPGASNWAWGVRGRLPLQRRAASHPPPAAADAKGPSFDASSPALLSPQVWFKNRRAKNARLKRLTQGPGQGPRSASTDGGVPDAPAPGTASIPAAAAAGSAPPEGPGFRSPSPPSPAGMLSAPAPGGVPSQGPAGRAPAQGAKEGFPTAAPASTPGPTSAPTPDWVQDPRAASDSWPDSVVIFDFTDLFPLQEPSHEPPSVLFSEYHNKGDNSADENDSGPRQFLSL
ncbi:tetrapeptide repeat homeobox protein 2-like [Moschus berezovskii]|uniref:tetrapeptide repeat homeobox protein 2-like n=1 Tax=Moschus berezovskii TaxID=68408 RepID=UPI002443FFD3|nr:tetrapeptide repeat homeobox protein 2-like [Moschus berezovskii]